MVLGTSGALSDDCLEETQFLAAARQGSDRAVCPVEVLCAPDLVPGPRQKVGVDLARVARDGDEGRVLRSRRARAYDGHETWTSPRSIGQGDGGRRPHRVGVVVERAEQRGSRGDFLPVRPRR